MAQFDIYNNPNNRTKNAYPLLLDIQHPVIEDLNSRIIIPIGKAENFRQQFLQTITPVIDYNGFKYVILTPQLASVPASILKNPVGSLRHFRHEIIAALNFAITGI